MLLLVDILRRNRDHVCQCHPSEGSMCDMWNEIGNPIFLTVIAGDKDTQFLFSILVVFC